MEINKILEHKSVWNYIISHNLLWQYKKAKNFLLNWNLKQIDFRIRKPKKDRIYYFKINIKYRVHCYFEWNDLIIFKIDDHQ